MNNEQFSLGMKISIIITCIVLAAGIILLVNVLRTKNTSNSVLEEVSKTNVEAQFKNNEELKQYLQVFALMVQEEKATEAKHLETSIGFLNQIFWYEPINTKEGYACYEEEIIKNVAREMLGVFVLETSEEIIYDSEYKGYRYALAGEFLNGKCMDISNVNKQDEIYEIEYTCTFPGESGLYELSEGKSINLTTYTIKAILQKNENYEYSKYYLKNIELLSKDIVQYN